MITLKLTDEEFMFLYCLLVTGKSDYKHEDQMSCCDKIADAYAPMKRKPGTNAIWEALKGVVG